MAMGMAIYCTLFDVLLVKYSIKFMYKYISRAAAKAEVMCVYLLTSNNKLRKKRKALNSASANEQHKTLFNINLFAAFDKCKVAERDIVRKAHKAGREGKWKGR